MLDVNNGGEIQQLQVPYQAISLQGIQFLRLSWLITVGQVLLNYRLARPTVNLMIAFVDPIYHITEKAHAML